MSVLPPAPNGTMTVTERAGQVSAAADPPSAIEIAIPASQEGPNHARMRFPNRRRCYGAAHNLASPAFGQDSAQTLAYLYNRAASNEQ